MFVKTEIALCAAVVLSSTLSVSAATTTKHHASHARRSAIYDVVPGNVYPPSPIQSGAPIRTEPDGW